jgi:hypothetical protein
MFAEDTGLLAPDQFTQFLERSSGEALGTRLDQLFEVLATPIPERRGSIQTGDLAAFPYVNGGLFDGTPLNVWTTAAVRGEVIASAKNTTWASISPAIFGAMFQTVLADVGTDRRQGGMHYTTERNIMRVIGPMFVDALERELGSIQGDKPRLRQFVDKLGAIKILDPACGCGNFLVVAYRELRRLERIALQELVPTRLSMADDLNSYRRVTIDQLYGIEIEAFPVKVAQIALHIAEHLENQALAAVVGQPVVEFPITATPNIACMDALVERDEIGVIARRRNWSDVLPADECTYVVGNPPFVGARNCTTQQSESLRTVWGSDYNGNLDFVTAWFIQAEQYMRENSAIRAAFVATSSISQGAQVAPLWKPLFRERIEIDFAHRTFAWTSEAAGQAHVHVVITGMSHRTPHSPPTRLFEYPNLRGEPVEVESQAGISPYLSPGHMVTVADRSAPLATWVPRMVFGSMPNDGGALIIEPEDLAALIADPIAAKYVRPLVGTKDMLNGKHRYCLWLADADPSDVGQSGGVARRVQRVRLYRKASSRLRTRQLADQPSLFGEIRQPTHGNYLAVPRHSSESRRVVPMATYDASTHIAHDSLLIIPNITDEIFGILQSAMWMAWLAAIGGRLESRYRISASGVYNTFPFPTLTGKYGADIANALRQVLAERSAHPGASLADLYKSNFMPTGLVKAHDELDRIVDRAFGLAGGRRVTDAQRLARLFEMYAEASG